MRVAVVGAGIMGASAALELTDRGHAVTLFEQFPLGHDRGSSHGRSRIVRRAYPDHFYTQCMSEAYPLWGVLQQRAQEPILYECGLMYFGGSTDSFDRVGEKEMVSEAYESYRKGSSNVPRMIRALRDVGVPHEVLDSAQVRRIMPHLHLGEQEVGVFTPEAGWVHAERALAATLRLAQSAGAVVRRQRIEDPEALATEFDAVALCTGGWVKKFVDLPVRVTLQTFAYLRGSFQGPVWIEDGEHGIYGFPSEPGGDCVKIGVHSHGREIDPDEEERSVSQEKLELISDFVLRRFGLEPEVIEAKGCLYTNTPDEAFRLGRISDRIVYASPCSGHGFKFGPWIGKQVAEMVQEVGG